MKPSNKLLPHFSLCSDSTSKKSCCQKMKQWIKSCDNFIWRRHLIFEGSLCCGMLSASPVSSVKCSHLYILLRSQMGYFLCNSAHFSFSSWWGSPLVLFLFYKCVFISFFKISHVSDIIWYCLSLTYIIIFRSIHVAENGIISFLWLNNIPLYVYTTSFFPIHQSLDT